MENSLLKLKKWGFNLFLAFAGLAVGLLLAEFCIRIFLPQTTYGGGLSYSDEAVFDLKANFTGDFSHPDYAYTVHTDENRLRLTWNPDDPIPDLRILVLGDSFAFGMGVNDDQTIASSISKQLHQWGIQARVYNAGVPSYNLGEIRCKYERIKDLIHPDIVVVTTVYNDFEATVGDCKSIYWGKKFLDQEKELKDIEPKLWSRAYPYIRDLALGNSQLMVFLVKQSLNFMIKMGLRDSFVGVLKAYNPDFHQYAKDRVDNVRPVLTDLHKTIQKDGTFDIFAYIPGVLEVDDNLWNSSVKLEKKPLLRDFPHRHLLSAAREAGFPIIMDPVSDPDNLETLRKSYFQIDSHLNAKGNDFWGKLVAQKIREHPAPPP